MKKFLDILLISLLIVLTIRLFFGPEQPQDKQLTGEILVETTAKNYTIPATVGLNIINNSTGAILMNTCDNISLNHSGVDSKITTDCENIVIESATKKSITYRDSYQLFNDAGEYTFKVDLEWKQHITSFETEHRWTISKLFIAVFYAPILNLLVFLIDLFNHSLGWAIVWITILIRILLIYPQHKMMVSQKKLQAIQPKIKKIQEENKGNQQVIGMKLMELYKTEKVNPMGSCGFLLIQMPILLVIYNIILSVKDPSNLFHLYSFQSDFSVESIDGIFYGVDLLQAGWLAGIILALSVGVIQFIQVKLSLAGRKSDNKDVVLEKKKDQSGYNQMMPDPEMMNKFMLYGMPAMVAVFTFTLIAWVGIYWGVSTTFMIFQQLVVNKILKK